MEVSSWLTFRPEPLDEIQSIALFNFPKIKFCYPSIITPMPDSMIYPVILSVAVVVTVAVTVTVTLSEGFTATVVGLPAPVCEFAVTSVVWITREDWEIGGVM